MSSYHDDVAYRDEWEPSPGEVSPGESVPPEASPGESMPRQPGGGRPRPAPRGGSHRKAKAQSTRRPPDRGPVNRRPPDPRPVRRSATSRSGYRRRRIVAGLVVVLVLCVLVAAGGVIYANHEINPGGRAGAEVTVTIPKDASTTEIGTILGGSGVIHAGGLFPYYTKVTGATNLLPGTYHLTRNESYDQAVTALQQGPPVVVVTKRLTIPEGFTLQQIAARVAKLPGLNLSAAKFLAVASSGQVRSPYEPAGSNDLEGLLYPATYKIRQGQVEADVLQEMVNAFDINANELGLTAGAAKLGMTPYQVVTVASIIEREAKLATDRGNVASAIYNRLAKPMKLGADSTQTYALRLSNPTVVPTVAQLEAPGPYNTRLDLGLPPTPIANPGIPSLRAAISPPATSYLFFVETNPDGQLSFASTDAGFAQLQSECAAAKLC